MRDNWLTKRWDKLRHRRRLYHGRGGGRRYVVERGGTVLINVHPETQDCRNHPCVIHNPSPEAEAIGPTDWIGGRMVRIAANGAAIPDPDAQAWYERTYGKDAA